METAVRFLFSILILSLGSYIFIKPNTISKMVTRFYSNYPIIRYAGQKQLTNRPIFIRIFGIAIIMVGLFGLLPLTGLVH